MYKIIFSRVLILVFSLLFTIVAVGCGGGGGSSSGSSSSSSSGSSSSSSSGSSSSTVVTTNILSGVGAVGTPILNANVSVVCASGTPLSTTTSSTGGVWQVTLTGQTLPCAVELGNGTINSVTNTTLYHSIAVTSGTTNITPFTDLLVANIAGTSSPATWFSGLTKSQGTLASISQTQVSSALSSLSLTLNGLPLSSNNPITTPFMPTTGNTNDDMLTAMSNAINATSGFSYAKMLSVMATATATTTTVPSSFATNLSSAYSSISKGSFSISGTASGLVGTVVLQNNGSNNTTVTSNGTFNFSSSLTYNSNYSVTVLTQPTGQTCVVTGGSGAVTSNVSDVAVACTSNTTTTTTGQNVLPILVDAGPEGANAVNTPYTSVTLCTPGKSTCQTIDHIIVDTGSSGLRIMSSVLSSTLALPAKTSSSGMPLYECTRFTNSYVWGSVNTADVKLGGEPTLSSVAIQIIGSSNAPSAPRGCSRSGGAANNTVATFGGNGILGVGTFQQDCGSSCVTAPTGTRAYYACSGTSSSSCSTTAVPLTQQVQNPVSLLPNDNNGVIISMPSVPETGATTASGSLILGIGTQSNNALTGVTVYTLNPTDGTFTTTYNGQVYSGSFVDSGSNALFFADSTISQCNSGFYCPRSTLKLSATNQATDGKSGTVNFSVVNADDLFANTSYTATSGLAGAGTYGFDWGLPFFYGRTVYTSIQGTSSGGVSGPYFAY